MNHTNKDNSIYTQNQDNEGGGGPITNIYLALYHYIYNLCLKIVLPQLYPNYL
jgi:hypothetical protein